jgi:hypothetical protein
MSEAPPSSIEIASEEPVAPAGAQIVAAGAEAAERRQAVLERLRTAVDASRALAVEALIISGLSEAEAESQVSAATGLGAAIEPLSATVERLDLGSYENDEPARAEFELIGGPGRLLPQTPTVTVTPAQFGPGVTRITVEAAPQPNGIVLTTLLAVTPAETLEIPLFARWAADAPAHGAPTAGAPARPAAAPPSPTSASKILVRTAVTVSRVMGFPRALALQRAIEQLPGVAEVKALGFEHNVLNLSIQHEASANLAELVSHVPGFQLSVTNSSLGRLQLASEGR